MANEMDSNPVSSGSGSFHGNCQVTCSQGKVTITTHKYYDKKTGAEKGQKKFPDGQVTKIFDVNDPKLPWTLKEGYDKPLNVHMFGGNITFTPYEGQFQAKFIGFNRRPRDAQYPTLTTVDSQYGTRQSFLPMFEITRGLFEKSVVLGFFTFKYYNKEKGKFTIIAFPESMHNPGKASYGYIRNPNGTTGADWSDLVNSLRFCGAFPDKGEEAPDFPSPNEPPEKVLVFFENRMKQTNMEVTITITEGLISNISPFDADEEEVVVVRKAPASVTQPLTSPVDVLSNPDVM